PGAEGHHGGTERRGGQEHLEPFEAIVRQQPDTVAAPDPRGAHALRHAASPKLKVCIGNAGSIDDHRRLCRGIGRLLTNQLEQCTTIGCLHVLLRSAAGVPKRAGSKARTERNDRIETSLRPIAPAAAPFTAPIAMLARAKGDLECRSL